MLKYCLRESVAKNILELLICIGDLAYPDCKYLWAGFRHDMSSMHKGNKSRFSELGNVRKRAQTNFLNPRLGLVLPSIVAPLNCQVASLDPWESQEEFIAVNIYGYEMFNCFAFETVTVNHGKCQFIYSIRSELVAFPAHHRDINNF